MYFLSFKPAVPPKLRLKAFSISHSFVRQAYYTLLSLWYHSRGAAIVPGNFNDSAMWKFSLILGYFRQFNLIRFRECHGFFEQNMSKIDCCFNLCLVHNWNIWGNRAKFAQVIYFVQSRLAILINSFSIWFGYKITFKLTIGKSNWKKIT